MSNVAKLYSQKLRTAGEAVKVVRSGDVVYLGEFAQSVDVLEKALALRVNELEDVVLVTTNRSRPLACVESDPTRAHFTWNDWHLSGLGRGLAEKGLASYIPFSYHQGPRAVEQHAPADVVFLQVPPMDAHGYFNFSVTCSMTAAYCRGARTIVLEVNPHLPRCHGPIDQHVHVSNVAFVVEGPGHPLQELAPAKASEVDRRVAHNVMELIEDGSTIQLGIGGLPSTVGALIAASDLKDLGVHTEMLCDSYVDMYEAGRITGKRKRIDRGKIVYTFAMGTKRLYDFVDDNPLCAIYPANYTNDPAVIAQNDKVMAINNALEVDLFSQVASESSGARQISGSGGQLDFIQGAFKSEGGKGLICVNSTYTRKDGTVVSRIVPTLSPGTIVTCPRSIVHYVVTEYGVAQLKGKSTWERAEALIAVAHPQFRDELVRQAKELNVWRRTARLM